MAGRVTQAYDEIASSGQTPNARVTQAYDEIASSGQTPNARVTQVYDEIASSGQTVNARVTQAFMEIIVWNTSAALYSSSTVQSGPKMYNGTISADPPPPIPISILSPSGGGKALVFMPKANVYDAAVTEKLHQVQKFVDAMRLDVLSPAGGLTGLGAAPQDWHWAVRYKTRKSFLRQGAIVTPYPSDGEVPIVEFVVPEGYYGVINGYYWNYTGAGYYPGSKDIYWRLRVGLQYPKGMNQILYQVGSPTMPFSSRALIVLRSRQRVRLSVVVPNDGATIQVGSSYVLGGLAGWFYEFSKGNVDG